MRYISRITSNVNTPNKRYAMMDKNWSDFCKKIMNMVIDVPRVKPNRRNIDITKVINPFLLFIFLFLF